MGKPKLRDRMNSLHRELYPINEIPHSIIRKIGAYFIYLLHIGRKDIGGDDWGDSLAYGIDGHHLNRPIGIADVVKDEMAWSTKTVKIINPFEANSVRLISGRCSPDYSYGITDPHLDVEATGKAILGIWNERINIAQDSYKAVRTTVLVRSYDLLKYSVFEVENHRFPTNNYRWEVNKNGNLVGYDIITQRHCFTWQPHGSQFTIHEDVPPSATKFEIKHPPIISHNEVLKTINFDDSWVTIFS